jgi:hypothetical protein
MLAMAMAGTPWLATQRSSKERLSPTVRAKEVGRARVSGAQRARGPLTGRKTDTMLEKVGARHWPLAQHWEEATKWACHVRSSCPLTGVQ